MQLVRIITSTNPAERDSSVDEFSRNAPIAGWVRESADLYRFW